jgi:SAM-dependent methyltransferase
MDFTGERFIPGVSGEIEAEHFHRYLLAAKIAAGRDVLDIACGEGYGSHVLAGVARSVVGVDIAIDAIDHARKTYLAPNLSFTHSACAPLPLVDDSVDLVVSFETIEHHDQHEAMIREFRRVLRPGGLVIISSPNRPEYDKTLSKPNPHHVKELDFYEFADLLSTFFQNTLFYAQRVLSGSILVPYQHEESGFTNFTGKRAAETKDELDLPIYFIAVAGDGDLPSLGTSLYECDEQTEKTHVSPLYLEARIYFSEYKNGNAQPYTEARSIAQVYQVDHTRKGVQLALPLDLQPISHVRLDIANAPVVTELHAMSLHNVSDNKIWQWDGFGDSLISASGVFILPGQDVLDLICLNGDPQFVIPLPQELLAKLVGGEYFLIEFTPIPLLDHLPTMLTRLQKLSISQPLARDSQTRLQLQLEELACVIKAKIVYKNALYDAQHGELESLRNKQALLYDQLLRAEAQLDLLKDVLLLGREEDRL